LAVHGELEVVNVVLCFIGPGMHPMMMKFCIVLMIFLGWVFECFKAECFKRVSNMRVSRLLFPFCVIFGGAGLFHVCCWVG
jgi:hypothetical protein